MPIGPRGEKRPSNPNAMSMMVARIATGRAEEEYANRRPGRAKDEDAPLTAAKRTVQEKPETEPQKS